MAEHLDPVPPKLARLFNEVGLSDSAIPPDAEAWAKLVGELVRDCLEAEAEPASPDDSIVDSIGDGVVILDAAGRSLHANPAACTLLDRTIEELWELGSIDSIVRPSGGLTLHEVLTFVDDEAGTLRDDAAIVIGRDGGETPVSFVLDAVSNASERSFVMLLRDMSEQRAIRTELELARDAAEGANRAKSEFLAAMSHEIRTPMNGVIGMLGLLMDSDLSSEQREYAETASRSGQSLLSLINDILDFSKVESGRLELEETAFDVREAVEEVAELLAETAQTKGLELCTRIDPAVPRSVYGDPTRVRQVLVNLLGNAIKFTEEGEIVLAVELAESFPDQVRLCFSVQDTGIGIAAESHARLFSAFSQADSSTTRRFGGTGLGLVICKRLAVSMGGDVDFDSEVGVGSTFRFTPRFRRVPGGRPELEETDMSRRLVGVRVLVVAANEACRSSMVALLETFGARAEVAPDARICMKLLVEAQQGNDPIRAVLIDRELPNDDGIELAGVLVADEATGTPGTILMTTWCNRLRWRDRPPEIGAIVTKPVRRAMLSETLALALGFRQKDEGGLGLIDVDNTAVSAGKKKKRSRILVVEDNRVNQRVAVHMIARYGHTTDVAANGIEAIEAIRQIPYDLVLMDCQMPEMDGFEATTAIRRLEEGVRHTPIVAMTANAMKGDRERCLEAGMDDYLSKPVRTEELEGKLQRWLPSVDDAS